MKNWPSTGKKTDVFFKNLFIPVLNCMVSEQVTGAKLLGITGGRIV